MEDDRPNKFRIINSLISLIVIIGFVAISTISYNNLNAKYENSLKTIEELKMQINSMDMNLFSHQNEINKNQMQLADVWMRLQGDAVLAKIRNWEEAHPEFVTCDKGFLNMGVYRNYYTYEGSPASVLAYQFKKGSMVQEWGGEMYCILEPYEMNPEHVDCKELCLDNQDEIK